MVDIFVSNGLVADFAGPEVHALLERSPPGPEAVKSSPQLKLRPQGKAVDTEYWRISALRVHWSPSPAYKLTAYAEVI